MDIFRIIGMVAVGIGALGVLWVLYHIVRGFILACDFVIWQYAMTKQSKPELKFELRVFFRGVMKNWTDMIGYTPDSFTCQIGSSEWQGFGSWRQK